MHRWKGKERVRINDHSDTRRMFGGFHMETLDIRYGNINQRQFKSEVSGELVIMTWDPTAWGTLL